MLERLIAGALVVAVLFAGAALLASPDAPQETAPSAPNAPADGPVALPHVPPAMPSPEEAPPPAPSPVQPAPTDPEPPAPAPPGKRSGLLKGLLRPR